MSFFTSAALLEIAKRAAREIAAALAPIAKLRIGKWARKTSAKIPDKETHTSQGHA